MRIVYTIFFLLLLLSFCAAALANAVVNLQKASSDYDSLRMQIKGLDYDIAQLKTERNDCATELLINRGSLATCERLNENSITDQLSDQK